MSEVLISSLIGVATVSVSYLTVRVNRPKVQSEAELASVTAMRETVLTLRGEVIVLRERIEKLEATERRLEALADQHQSGIDILVGQVRELGSVPRWPLKRQS